VEEGEEAPSTGGRRAVTLRLRPDAGLVLAADIGVTHCRSVVADLTGTVLHEIRREITVSDGPEPVLGRLLEDFATSMAAVDRPASRVWGVGIGVPGPVEFSTGRPVSPPIMPGWNEVSIPHVVQRHLDAPVFVDNDVNIMALGEYAVHWAGQVDDLLFVKVSTGIGAGIIAGRRLQRGAAGTAGDLGHVPVLAAADVRCRCGNTGCIEAVAGGGALAERLSAAGHDVHDVGGVVALTRDGDLDAVALVREAGREVGEVLATVVNILNPAVLVLGGTLADSGDELYAGVREVVYRRSTALATRGLRIEHARLGERAGVVGAVEMVLAQTLDEASVNAYVARQAEDAR
jgi:predicted NBD/HSP70 family sugar kinase